MIIKKKNISKNADLIRIPKFIDKSFFTTKQHGNKKYLSEIILITNHNNKYTLFDWLFWHLNIIKFDHVVLIDNNSTFDVKNICNMFGDKVTYIFCDGDISQSELYTKYVNISDAQWVLPIDDDEFLYVSEKYKNNINVLLEDYAKIYSNIYKFNINWVMMFSQSLLSDISDISDYFNTFDYTNNVFRIINNRITNNIECFNYAKSIVNTDIMHFYPKDSDEKIMVDCTDLHFGVDCFVHEYDQFGSVHNPISMLNNNYILSYNVQDKLYNAGFFRKDVLDYNGDTLLFHYKYRTIKDWNHKITKRKRFNDLYSCYSDNYNDNIIYTVYSYSNNFTKCDIIKKLYNKYKNEIDYIKNKL